MKWEWEVERSRYDMMYDSLVCFACFGRANEKSELSFTVCICISFLHLLAVHEGVS